MKLTNKKDLPQAVVDAVRNDEYTRGESDISVTALIDSPRIKILKERHDAEIEEDASDRIWSLIGQCVHTLLERANVSGVAERRLSMLIEGWRVSGGMDLFDESSGMLSDYKVTSVWSLIYGDRGKWEKQLNCYAAILRANGHAPKRLQAVAILRDWSKNKASQDPNYPQCQIVNIDIPMWEEPVTAAYMRDRVILHQQAYISLPDCTREERWADNDTWAVKKRGNKTAVRGGIHTIEKAATEHAALEPHHYVEHRPGAAFKRCAAYCQVAAFCDQYKRAREAAQAMPIGVEEIN